jgi:hypothetical protein
MPYVKITARLGGVAQAETVDWGASDTSIRSRAEAWAAHKFRWDVDRVTLQIEPISKEQYEAQRRLQ